MATALQRTRLRSDLGLGASIPTDLELDDIFLRASEEYPASEMVSDVRARVITLNQMLSEAAKRIDYVANAFSIKAGDVFKHLQMLRDLWKDEFCQAQARDSDASQADWRPFAETTNYTVEYPNEY